MQCGWIKERPNFIALGEGKVGEESRMINTHLCAYMYDEIDDRVFVNHATMGDQRLNIISMGDVKWNSGVEPLAE